MTTEMVSHKQEENLYEAINKIIQIVIQFSHDSNDPRVQMERSVRRMLTMSEPHSRLTSLSQENWIKNYKWNAYFIFVFKFMSGGLWTISVEPQVGGEKTHWALNQYWSFFLSLSLRSPFRAFKKRSCP